MKTAQSRPCGDAGPVARAAPDAEPSAADGGLYPAMPEPLRSHMHYINAALSTYDGSPCVDDVRLAWGAITAALAAAPDLYEAGRIALADVADALRSFVPGHEPVELLNAAEKLGAALAKASPT